VYIIYVMLQRKLPDGEILWVFKNKYDLKGVVMSFLVSDRVWICVG
jgi:hypothetical protein